jgi:hypothetical protein
LKNCSGGHCYAGAIESSLECALLRCRNWKTVWKRTSTFARLGSHRHAFQTRGRIPQARQRVRSKPKGNSGAPCGMLSQRKQLNCQQNEGAAKRAQTPLRALACFVPALLRNQTRASFCAGEPLFSRLECDIIPLHPPNTPL